MKMAQDSTIFPEIDLMDESQDGTLFPEMADLVQRLNILLAAFEEDSTFTARTERCETGPEVDNDKVQERIMDPKSMEGRIYMGVMKRVLSEMNERYVLPPRSQNESPGLEGDEELTVGDVHPDFVEDIWCRMVVRVADRIRTPLRMKFSYSHVDPVENKRSESLSYEDVKGLQIHEVFIIQQLFWDVNTLMQNILGDGVLIDSLNNESPPQELTEAQILESESMFQEQIYLFFVSKVLAEAETPFVFPPGSSPGQGGDETPEEAEILDPNVIKKEWMKMVKQVAHSMLSASWLSDEAHYLAEDLWSHVIALQRHKYEEEWQQWEILISPMVELIENFKGRIEMISRDFEMNHPSRRRKRS